jgi:hypothetical protein
MFELDYMSFYRKRKTEKIIMVNIQKPVILITGLRLRLP